MTSARALGIVRVAVGAILLVRTTPLLVPLGFRFAEAPLVGWPDGRFHIALFALPTSFVCVLTIVRTLAAASFTIGYRARAAGVIAAMTGYLVITQDALSYVNSLQLLYVSSILVALADSSCVLAVRPEPARSMRSSLWLVRAIPLSVYLLSATAKLNAQFMSGAALRGFCEDGFIRGVIARVACSPSRAHAASIVVIVCELGLPLLLLVRKSRRVGLALAIVFHVTLEIAMHPDVFGWLMMALLISFVDAKRTTAK